MAGGPVEEVVSGLASSLDGKGTRGIASKAPSAADPAVPNDAARHGFLEELKDSTPDADTCGTSSTTSAPPAIVDAGRGQGSGRQTPTCYDVIQNEEIIPSVPERRASALSVSYGTSTPEGCILRTT